MSPNLFDSVENNNRKGSKDEVRRGIRNDKKYRKNARKSEKPYPNGERKHSIHDFDVSREAVSDASKRRGVEERHGSPGD